ncbi:MAG: TSUP family transporter [Pseudomonadota bacterium]
MFTLGAPPEAALILFIAVAISAAVQRLAGQGLGMIVAPIAALIAPQHLPATLLMIGLATGAGALSMDIRAVDWREAPWGMLGRALGAFAGAALAAALAGAEGFGIAVAVIILAAIALTLSGLRIPITPASLTGAGLTAGVMGTMTAVGAPPMAILYGREEAARSRAMQNLFFVWGMAWSLAALALFGLIGAHNLAMALLLAPAVFVGLWASRPAARRLQGRPILPFALGLSGLAALTLLARSL